jgi:hypothetical protein
VVVDVLWWVLRVGIALTAAVLLYLLGAKMIRNFNTEPPPEPGETPLEDVDYRYQCIVCGAQAVLYAAPEGEIPDPPRHCREPMLLVTPVE